MMNLMTKMFIIVMILVATVFIQSGVVVYLGIQLDSCQNAASMCVDIVNDITE